jgi:magnesium chelatase family protein
LSLAIIDSRAQRGIYAPEVSVEVHLANGLPSLNIVGLPETAVKENKDRVRTALTKVRFEFPIQRTTTSRAARQAEFPRVFG